MAAMHPKKNDGRKQRKAEKQTPFSFSPTFVSSSSEGRGGGGSFEAVQAVNSDRSVAHSVFC